MNTQQLTALGWQDMQQAAFDAFRQTTTHAQQLMAVRVIEDFGQSTLVDDNKQIYQLNKPVQLEDGIYIGDWLIVTLDQYQDDRVHYMTTLPRQSELSRKAAGSVPKRQIIATNIDTVFIVQSMNDDLNIKRLERYLVAVWDSGAMPVIVLTKRDLADDYQSVVNDLQNQLFGVSVIAVSAIQEHGLDPLKSYLTAAKTIAIVGSSGVGKTTLTNQIVGYQRAKVQAIRADDAKGRHTTTHRFMARGKNGVLLIDTPGMREFMPWESPEGIDEVFADITQLAASCKFNNCQHRSEPNCAIKEALQAGTLLQSHYDNWQKLKREQAYLEKKQAHANRLKSKSRKR